MRKKLAALAAAFVLCLAGTACGNAAKTYTDYVQAVMDCTYLGQDVTYRKLTKSADAEVQALIDDENRYLCSQLCHQASVDSAKLSPETAESYTQLADTLRSKVKYSVADAVSSGNTYQVTITAEPLDLFIVSVPDMETAYRKEFSEKFYKASEGTPQYDKLEADWGARALEIYQSHAETVGCLEAQSITVSIRADADGHYNISSADWQKIDQLLFGLAKPQ